MLKACRKIHEYGEDTCDVCGGDTGSDIYIGCGGDGNTCPTWVCLQCSPFKTQEEATTSNWSCPNHYIHEKDDGIVIRLPK